MKKSLLKIISFCIIFLTTNNLLSQENNWEEHFINDTVKIEFSYQIWISVLTASQELVVFRFTNLTNENVNLSYSTKNLEQQ